MIKQKIKKKIKKLLDRFEINFVADSKSVLGLTPKKVLRQYLDNFRPVDNGYPLIRIGEPGDGGYLVPDDLEGITACFSPGSDMLWTFESQLAERYGIQSFICDRAERMPSNLTQNQHFTNAWLGPETKEGFISLSDWVNNSEILQSKDLLLQIDIEDAEWRVLSAIDFATLLKFRVIVIELHFLSQMRNRLAFEKVFQPGLNKLFENFDVVHAHPNNCCGTFTIDGVEFPELIEVTFHRKDRSKAKKGFRKVPNELDARCVPTKEELYFPWQRSPFAR